MVSRWAELYGPQVGHDRGIHMGPTRASPSGTHVGFTWAPGGPHLGKYVGPRWVTPGMPMWDIRGSDLGPRWAPTRQVYVAPRWVLTGMPMWALDVCTGSFENMQNCRKYIF